MKKITYLYIVYLLLPIALLAAGSFGERWVNTLLPTGSTLAWYEELWNSTAYRNALVMSLQVCLATCVLNLVCITPCVYLLQIRQSELLNRITRVGALLPIAVPELVIGFGFILAFSTSTLPWLGASWLLVIGHWVLTFPYFFFSLSADMEKSPLTSLDRAAQSFGASGLQRFITVFLPLARQSILTGLITVAAISLGEFQLSNLIAGFMNRTYPTLLLQAFYGATGLACAATLVLLLLAMLMSLLSSYPHWSRSGNRAA
ncbi:ABC transporter permease [Marinobacterium lutimaris]|uniref:Putative spermidine/putrescine transport system permease protein n=1 Tax=Marinobacterium lutimaris TaxID=568106 RepID=A0A1H6DLB8_9GAMM|nr:ABC transporter permease subunit [Marinobacterium lutimaris]SEG86082.1 putative spermidine/putrescine transport system permease protein [Marinobacterium lutimaris]